jgi:glyoxylase-like metal-dependent hydrolase (beta-lactamase superfamily II)
MTIILSFKRINFRRAALYAGVTLGAAFTALLLFVAYQVWPSALAVARYADTTLDYRLPRANPSGPDIKLNLVVTGHHDGPEALIYRGGRLSTTHRAVFSGVVVRHPQATFLFEGGIGSSIAGEFERNFSGWQKRLFAYVADEPLLSQLKNGGIDPGQLQFLLLTHLHWDHAGVIRDFPDTPVRVTREEYEGSLKAADEGSTGTFREQFDDPSIKWDFVQFADTPYGPYRHSLDLFNDQSIVLVPLAGHTPGGLGMFVTLKSGERYFFIGDLSWSEKAVEIPSERIPFARGLADNDAEAVRRELAFAHEVWRHNPRLHIIPAHDADALAAIPPLARPTR